MSIQTLILLGWVTLVLVAVSGVFVGVLRPTGRNANIGRRSKIVRIDSCAAFLASKRVWILAAIVLIGMSAGVLSASQTLDKHNQGQSAGNTSGRDSNYGQGAIGRSVDLLYEAVREMAGDVEPRPGHPLASRIARTSGLATLLLLALELIVKLFHEPVQRLRLRLHHDHVVICGLGRVGRELTAACRQSGMPVAIVEREGSNCAIAEAKELGAVVWVGDLTSKRVLRLVGANRARHVFFVSGSDEQNLEAANDLLMVLLEPRGSGNRTRSRIPKITMHLDRPELSVLLSHMKRDLHAKAESVKSHFCRNLARRSRIDKVCMRVDENTNRVVHDGFEIRAFNVADRSIRDLFDLHVLNRRPTGADEVAHFVILGFGAVGERVALHLAGQAHFENHRRPRMTIVHRPQDAIRVERFLAQYPAFFPNASERGHKSAQDPWAPDPALDEWRAGVRVADVLKPTDEDRGVHFVVNGGFVDDAAGPLSPDVINRLVGLSRHQSVRPMVFICDAEDEDNCSQSVELRSELDLRLKQHGHAEQIDEHSVCIFPNVPARPMLTQLTAPKDHRNADLIPFGDGAVSCTYHKLSSDPASRIAQAIHRDYFTQHGSACEAPPSWDDLALWERRSNLSAAMHINAKLRVLGLRLVPKQEAGSPEVQAPDAERVSPDIRETIAIMEHNRWMAERLLSGWSLGARQRPENKRRHQFVPWEMLEQDSKDRDLSQLDAALRVCGQLTSGEDAEFALVAC